MLGTVVIVSVVLDQLTLLNHFLTLLLASHGWAFLVLLFSLYIPSREANILNEGQSGQGREIRQQFIIL